MQSFLTVAIEAIALGTLALILLAEMTRGGRRTPPESGQALPPLPRPQVAPVVARALPPLLQTMSRRQLLAIARSRRVPNYSRTDTATLRAILAAA